MPCTKEKIKHKAKNIDTCTYIKYNIFMKKKGDFRMARQQDNRNFSKVKSPATIEAQLEKLKSRGCIIEDEEHAINALSHINYYRLVHYFSVFLKDKHTYRDGTSFEAVMRIYDFDRLLRSLLLTVLEEIEITLRAHVSNYHALKYGALGYLNEASFDCRHNHKQFLNKVDRMIESNTGEEMVTHHMRKYGGAFPLWVIMELFSFGTLNTFFSDLITEDKRAIAQDAFGLPYRCAENWLQCLSSLRNHCAHYNRLYANDFPDTPKQPTDSDRPISNTLFDYIIIMKYLYPRKERWNSVFLARLAMLIAEYSDVLELNLLGFPDNWRELLAQEGGL